MMLIVVKWAGRVISGIASSLTYKMPAVNSHKNVMKFGVFFFKKVMSHFFWNWDLFVGLIIHSSWKALNLGKMDKRSLW